MQIQIETPAYDAEALGKPSAAVVSFNTPAGEFDWQPWIGHPGEEGVLQITAEPGDVIARCQKDNATHKAIPAFYRLTKGGELERLPSRASAWRHWTTNQKLEEVLK